MAVIKTLKGQTVVTVVCDIVYDGRTGATAADTGSDNSFKQHFDKMASAWRVLVFFMIVFVVPVLLIALPLYARYTLYPTRSLSLIPADTLNLQSMLSSFWCQGERMNSNGTFDAYLMSAPPRLDKRRRVVTAASSVMFITEEQPETKVLHLLKGSSFKLSLCARWPGATVIVVRGEENFKRCYYKEDRDWDDIVELQKDSDKKSSSVEVSPRLLLKTSSEQTVRQSRAPTTVGLMAPTNADVFEDSESNGGENIDGSENSFDVLDLEYKKTRKSFTIDDGSNTMSPITSKAKLGIKETKDDLEESANGILLLDEGFPKNKSKLLRVLRSLTGYADDADGSDENRRKEKLAMEKLGLLHTVNDTRDVFAGNSSVSSSEEFMERCKDTLLYNPVAALPTCQHMDLTDSDTYDFRVSKTDEYYFIFMSDNSLEENVLKYYIEVDRTMYNVTENIASCTNITECVFPISFLSSESVVVEMSYAEHHNNSPTGLSTYEMKAICQPRVAVYMVFILLVPFIILMFAFQ